MKFLGEIMQSKLSSLVESFVNVGIGFLVALVAQLFIFPLFGFNPSFGEQFQIALLFTVVSIVRSYFIRRLFNYFSYMKNR